MIGRLNHVAIVVPDLVAAAAALYRDALGAHGKPVLFLHPKDFCGTLIELEEA
jgi:methylmalonyl-CoA/ethylmalonyl-CoA epimerase